MLDRTLVITDTSYLIVLSRIGELELLHKLYSGIIVTDVIAAEFGEPTYKAHTLGSRAGRFLNRTVDS